MTRVTFSTQTTHSHVSFCNSWAIDQVGPVAISSAEAPGPLGKSGKERGRSTRQVSSAEAPGPLGESGKERGRSARKERRLILRSQKEAFRDITTR